MLIYRFKIHFEDHDDFQREIELRADQTFEDFHQAILGNLGLDPGMLASFFICDHRYRKLKEIKLVDPEHIIEQDKLDTDADTENPNKKLVMHQTGLKDFIDDPHQRMIFLYDYLNQWTFYLELFRILPLDNSQTYPRFSKSHGPVPRELIATPKQIPGVETQMDFSLDDEEVAPEDIAGMDQINDADFYNDDSGDSSEDLINE